MDAKLEFQKQHVLFLAAPHSHSLSFSFPQSPLTLTHSHSQSRRDRPSFSLSISSPPQAIKPSFWPSPLSSPPQLGASKLSLTNPPSLSLTIGNSLHFIPKAALHPHSHSISFPQPPLTLTHSHSHSLNDWPSLSLSISSPTSSVKAPPLASTSVKPSPTRRQQAPTD